MKKTLHFSIKINAPVTTVWQKMLDLEPYKVWTAAFAPGSSYEGSWEEGTKIKFLDGKGNGMVSFIEKNQQYKFVSIKHLGDIIGDKENTSSAAVEAWAPAYENYTFNQIPGGTELNVSLEVTPDFEDYMQKTWPSALAKLKEISEAEIIEFGSPITVEAEIKAPLEKVWELWTQPEHIKNWYFASEDWHAPSANNDLKVGGKFATTMAAKDGSASFEFEGLYTDIKNKELIEYELGDGRKVKISFSGNGDETKLTETFDPESTNPREMQQGGWQSILNNFKKYVESS